MLFKFHNFALDFVGNISIIRLIYTIILVALIFTLGREAYSVWIRGKIFLSDFSYFNDGSKSADRGEQLRDETIQNYRLIIGLMNTEHAARQENPFEPEGRDPADGAKYDSNFLTQKVSDLSQIDITIQGVNLKSIITAFSSFVSPRNVEISAKIFETNKQRRTFLTLSGTPAERRQQGLYEGLQSVLTIDTPSTDEETAFRLGCFLIWIQLDKTNNSKAADPSFGISFDEFCDWAKLLRIHSVLAAADPNRLEERMKRVDIEFLKVEFSRAATLTIGYQQIYASLGAIDTYLGAERIKLTADHEIEIESVGDLIRYFGLIDNPFRDRPKRETKEDWLKRLTPESKGTRNVNAVFFADMLRKDCGKNDDIPEGIKSQAGNVVRIKSPTGSITTGLIVGPATVLTVFQGRVERIAPVFVSAQVELAKCGEVVSTYTVTAAKAAFARQASPFVFLTVPGLPARPLPQFAFDGPDIPSATYVVGRIRDTKLIFASSSELRQSDKSSTDNHDTYITPGETLAKLDPEFFLGSERRFQLSTPFAAGLTGAPVFNRGNQVIGMIDGGNFVGTNLQLQICVSIQSLRKHEILSTFAAQQ